MEGLEPNWVQAGIRRSAFYTHLPPGAYRFAVTARNADGVWNETGAQLAFTVAPHFWQTWWFKLLSRGLLPLLVLGTVIMSVRRRAKRKLRVVEQQRALERERGRIARDIHDELGGNLTRIVMLSESVKGCLKEPPQAATDLQEISQTARDLTLQMSEIVWAVNPEHDTLDSLANYIGKYAHDFLRASGVRCRLDMPVALPSRVLDSPVRHNVFLALKEALNNVVKHARAANVEISLRLEPEVFELRVADDGRGFDPKAPNLTGNGLGNLKHRLRETGGYCEITSHPGQGTTLRLVVPFGKKAGLSRESVTSQSRT
jgi:signal transduction histidine kinase